MLKKFLHQRLHKDKKRDQVKMCLCCNFVYISLSVYSKKGCNGSPRKSQKQLGYHPYLNLGLHLEQPQSLEVGLEMENQFSPVYRSTG